MKQKRNILGFLLVLFFCGPLRGAQVTRNLPEKPMVIVITSFNNQQWYQFNLDSVFAQNYHNYRVIYLDDASGDGTADLVEQYIAAKNMQDKVTLVRNPTWVSQMANHYKAVRMCHDHEIVVHLDGDDALAHPDVLTYVNNVYSTSATWMTYGAPLIWPANNWRPQFVLDLSRQLPNMIAHNSFRHPNHWHFGHLRTFYAWLFKHIRFQDLIDKSSFIPMVPAPDVGLMIPMLEMAGAHVTFTEPVLYLWNRNNPLSQPGGPQMVLINTVCSWPKYHPLANPDVQISQKYQNATSDALIISTTATHTESMLAALNNYVAGVNKIVVLYPMALNPSIVDDYQTVKSKWPSVSFIEYNPQGAFKTVFSDAISRLRHHIIVASDKGKIIDHINMNNCIKELEITKAYGFYFFLVDYKSLINQPNVAYAAINDEVLAFQPNYGIYMRHNANALNFTLYRKRHIKKRLATMTSYTLAQFKSEWAKYKPEHRSVGLFLKTQKAK